MPEPIKSAYKSPRVYPRSRKAPSGGAPAQNQRTLGGGRQSLSLVPIDSEDYGGQRVRGRGTSVGVPELPSLAPTSMRIGVDGHTGATVATKRRRTTLPLNKWQQYSSLHAQIIFGVTRETA